MPLVNIGLQQQEQAADSGISSYPIGPKLAKTTKWDDIFNRETLNPTNAYVLYTVAAAGAGTGTILNRERLRLTSGGTIGNDVDCRASGFAMRRELYSPFLDNRSQIIFECTFTPGQVADIEAFIGILRATAITALPTTARHMGIFLDISVSANYFLTSGDGTTQTTTDTGIAPNTSDLVKIRVRQTSINGATIEFFSDASTETVDSTQTVTALGLSTRDAGFTPHFFVQTEAAATKILDIFTWGVSAL